MVFRFGEYAFDEERMELLCSGEPVPLEPKPRALLLHLLRRHPTVVGPEEILSVVWPDAVVTRASVARAVRALRRALGERHGADSVVRSVRGQGYGIAHPVTREGMAALRPGSSPTEAAPGMVGRREPMRRLGECLARAEVGRGSAATVVGEPGIGKTRLLEAVGERAQAARWTVLGARCTEDAGAPALWPWVQVLRAAVSAFPADRIEAASGARAAELLRVEPTLLPAERRPRVRGRLADEGGETRFRLFDAVDAFLAALARDAPLLVAIDDLQWADTTSLALFEHVARNVSGRSMVLLACHRPGSRSELDAMLERVAALPGAQPPIRLDGLSRAELREIAANVAGVSLDDPQAQELHERSGGNPFFAIELLRSGDLGPLPDTAAVDGAAPVSPVPERIRAVVRTRVAALPAEARSLLDLAAVAGDEVTLALLSHALDLPEAPLLDAIQAAEHAGLLAEDPASPGRFRFSHALLAESLYEGLSRRTRAELHGRVATALEAISGPNPGPRAASLAHHWRLAATAEANAKAVQYAKQAADHAADQLAFAEAARLYQQAIDWQADRSAAGADLARLWIALAGAQQNAGRPEASEQAAWEALTLAGSVGSPELVADAAWRLTAGQYRGEGSERLVRALETAIAAEAAKPDGGDPRTASRLWGLLARTLTYRAPFARVEACSKRSLELARDADDALVELRALATRDLVLASEPRYEERAALSRDRVRLATELDHTMEAFQARVYRAQRLIQEIEPEAFDTELRELERLADELSHSQRCRGFVLDLKALRALWRGDIAEARELVVRIPEVWSAVDPLYGMMSVGAKRYLLAGLSGDWQAIDENEVLRARGPTQYALPRPYQCALAVRRLELGREAEAREDFAYLARHDFADLQRDATYLIALVQLALLAHHLEDAPRAAALAPLLEPYAGRYASGHTTAIRGVVDRYRALLAWTCGDLARAEELLRAAREQERRMQAPPWEALVEIDLARLLLARGGAKAIAEAQRSLDRVAAICEALPLAGIEALAEPVARSVRAGA